MNQATESSPRVRSTVFVSYSHTDKETEWYRDVLQYLRQLNVGDEIEIWDDTAIRAGDDWLEEIESRLRLSMAAVFLISPTFITSDFIARKEVPRVLERLERDGLIVHALIAKPTDWATHPIGDFLSQRQLVHGPEDALEAMPGPERRRCLNKLVKQLREEIGIHRNRFSRTRRDSLMREIEQSQALADVELLEEVAGGDTSIIYRARRGRRDLAVKVLIARTLSDAGEAEIEDELKKARGLRHPAFITIEDVHFANGQGFVVADWIHGQPLKRLMHLSRTEVDKQRWWVRATSIMCDLARAMAEAHEHGLQYINFDPTNVTIQSGSPRIYPIDFSTWIAATEHSNGSLSVMLERLELLAPEILERRFDRWSPASDAAEDAAFAARKKEQQYTLGMVLLALLEGRSPVTVRSLRDLEELASFQRDPRGFHESRLQASTEDHWSRLMPGLARVVWRMLSPDPADRWDGMSDVAQQLRATLRGIVDIPAHVGDAKRCYSDHLRGNERFFRAFYDAFFERAPDIRHLFAGVDMGRQKRLLDEAFERLLNFRSTQVEPTTLTGIAESHRKFALSPDHFEAFGRAFLDALDSTVDVNAVTRDSWESVIWPGLRYLQERTCGPQMERE
ncbi:MAG: TIR domain-containing protein [Planctomycetota bacterium]